MRKIVYQTLILLFVASNYCGAQIVSTSNQISVSLNDSNSFVNSLTNFPNKFFNKINNKTVSLKKRLGKKTEKYLRKFIKQEEKLKSELYKSDSNSAKYLFFTDPTRQFHYFQKELKTDTTYNLKNLTAEYSPYTDSLKTLLSFLNKNPEILNSHNSSNIQSSLDNLKKLQSEMLKADEVKQYIIQRKEQIKQFFIQHAKFRPGLNKFYSDYNKRLYYYSAQLQEYKQILNDPDKTLKTVLKALNKFPAFSAFMQKNSILTALFNVPGNYNMQDALPGLQNKDMIDRMIKSQISAGGKNAAAVLNKNFQASQEQLQKLKDKISFMGVGSENVDLPGNFKPNNQKTKTVLQRLQLGTNIQTTHSTYYFPTTTDLGFSLGYLINDKNIVGIGIAYKIGWGENINHIHLSSQGAGLRSFLDIKIKGSFYATGGFEYNYQKITPLRINPLVEEWSRSGLIGISKTIPTNSKYFKKSKFQLLWDFLSYQQVPRGQAIKFRIGYNF